MSAPYIVPESVWVDKAVSTTAELRTEFCQTPTVLLEIKTTGFSGTLTIQGRRSEDGAWSDVGVAITYVVDTGTHYQSVLGWWYRLRLVMTRTAGTISLHALGIGVVQEVDARLQVWDTATTQWVKMTQPIAEIVGGTFTLELDEVEALLTDIRDDGIDVNNVLFEDYQYMGSQTIGLYKYLGFKQYGGTAWYIARKTTATGLFQYAYSSGGGNDWGTAWAAPAGEVYSDPPDA